MGTRGRRLAHGKTEAGSRHRSPRSWGSIWCERKILDPGLLGCQTGGMAGDGQTAGEIGQGLVDWLSDGEADPASGGPTSGGPTSGGAATTDRPEATGLAAGGGPTDPTDAARQALAVADGAVQLTGSLADTILRGIAAAHPGGIEGWIEDIASDPDQRVRLLPTINKILAMAAGAGDTNHFHFEVTAAAKPVIDVTPEELQSFAEDLKKEARG